MSDEPTNEPEDKVDWLVSLPTARFYGQDTPTVGNLVVGIGTVWILPATVFLLSGLWLGCGFIYWSVGMWSAAVAWLFAAAMRDLRRRRAKRTPPPDRAARLTP